MKIEFIEIESDFLESRMIRVFDYDLVEIKKFYQVIQEVFDKKNISLDQIDFIELVNCNLSFRLGEDKQTIEEGSKNFICELTIGGFEELLQYLEPLTIEFSGHQFLVYPNPGGIELLASPSGGW